METVEAYGARTRLLMIQFDFGSKRKQLKLKKSVQIQNCLADFANFVQSKKFWTF